MQPSCIDHVSRGRNAVGKQDQGCSRRKGEPEPCEESPNQPRAPHPDRHPYRPPGSEASEQARKALSNIENIRAIRRELADAVRGLFASVTDTSTPALSEADTQGLIDISVFAVRSRSAVERDPYRREIELIPDPEAPGRMATVLARLYLAMIGIGIPMPGARALIGKIALDSMPSTRRAVLDVLLQQIDAIDTTGVAERTGYPTTTTRRNLEDLTAHGIADRIPAEKQGKADRWTLSAWARENTPRSACGRPLPYLAPYLRKGVFPKNQFM
jgi:hypothetical protein